MLSSLLLALLAVQPASAVAGLWIPTGSMSGPRSFYTATLLGNGQVLVAGGAALPSAELYHPATGKWTMTGSMTTPRTEHAATLLPGGKVLVTGGFDDHGSVSTELYDPATGLWSSAASMGAARVGHNATLLANGKVLVSGGYLVSTAELYDPITNTWTFTGSMNNTFDEGTALLLPDGRVLVVGCFFPDPWNHVEPCRAELYDPGTGEWTPASPFNTPRVFRAHTLTLLSNGKVLLAGGLYGAALASAELYDPAADTWTETGSLVTAREGHAASLLPDGKVLVSGGGGLSSAEIYDPVTGTWSLTGSLSGTRRDHFAFLLPNGKALVLGGWDWRGRHEYLVSAELYTSTQLLPLKSSGPQDGWVLETSENSNQGGTINATATTFLLGDNASNRQYLSILSFNTSALPDNAVITRAVLKIKKQGMTGTDPFTTHGKIAVDIRQGAFSQNAGLQSTDFQAAATVAAAMSIGSRPQAGGWYVARLNAAAYPFINRTGATQFRLRFQLDDDNDTVADFLRFYSGDAAPGDRPILVIEYYVP